MKKRYYAANNQYATEWSIGFANTWMVYVFADMASRDKYVNDSSSMAARAIKRSEIGKYIDRPKPFSGKCWQIAVDPCNPTPGLIGQVVTDWTDGGIGDRL